MDIRRLNCSILNYHVSKKKMFYKEVKEGQDYSYSNVLMKNDKYQKAFKNTLNIYKS